MTRTRPILIVDDDPDAVALTKHALAKAGIKTQIDVMADGAHAIGYLKEKRIRRQGPLMLFYDGDPDRGDLVAHVAVPVGATVLAPPPPIEVLELPAVREAATYVHRGPGREVSGLYGDLARWAEERGYQSAGHGRDVLIEPYPDEAGNSVNELQLPLVPRSDGP